MRILALALILVAPTIAGADDIGSTMAALKDEKAQCRYLLQLCGEYAIDAQIASENLAAAQTAVAQAKTKREAAPAMARAEVAMSAKRQSLDKVTSARSVMKAMHEKMPPCVEECVDDKGKKILATW